MYVYTSDVDDIGKSRYMYIFMNTRVTVYRNVYTTPIHNPHIHVLTYIHMCTCSIHIHMHTYIHVHADTDG